VLHRLPHLVGETVELRVDPLLEPRQIGVTLGEQAVVLKKRPQMLGRPAGNAVKALVGDGDRSVTRPRRRA
jgi:hypothetical protein